MNLCTIILVFLLSDRCLDEVFDNQANYQGYKRDVYFFHYDTLTVCLHIWWVVGEFIRKNIWRIIFIIHIWLSNIWWCQLSKVKKHDKKPWAKHQIFPAFHLVNKMCWEKMFWKIYDRLVKWDLELNLTITHLRVKIKSVCYIIT